MYTDKLLFFDIFLMFLFIYRNGFHLLLMYLTLCIFDVCLTLLLQYIMYREFLLSRFILKNV
jgi:hypothetical protein